jgi:hypothetical protein
VVLVTAYVAKGVLGYFGSWRLFATLGATELIVFGVQLAKWLLLALAAYLLWRGRNSGRVLLLFFLVPGGLALLVNFWSMSHLPGGVNYLPDLAGMMVLLLPCAVYLTSSILVYFPGRAWFRRGAR